MRAVEVSFTHRDHFAEVFLPDLEGGGMFVETEDGFAVGDRVALNLVFPEIREGVPLEGVVRWRRAPTRWRSALVPGIGVEFGDRNRSRVEFLREFCQGAQSVPRKQGRRVPADFRVDIISQNQRISAQARDISRGGLFVVTRSDFDVDEELLLDLFFEQQGPPERFSGRVAWRRGDGRRGGIGIEFLFRTPYRRMQINRVVGEIEGRLFGPAVSV